MHTHTHTHIHTTTYILCFIFYFTAIRINLFKSIDESAHIDPIPHAATNVPEAVSVDEQQQVTTSENHQGLLKHIEKLSKEDKSEFLKKIQNDYEKIPTMELNTLRVSSHKVTEDYPQVAKEKLKLIPIQYCKCNQCPIAHNLKEAFCCQSSDCRDFHNGHSDQCVTKSEVKSVKFIIMLY